MLQLNKTYLFLIVFLIEIHKCYSQIGGRSTYSWLSNAPNARQTALANSQIAVQNDDLSLSLSNPALLNIKSNKAIYINHNFGFAGVSQGSFGYGHSIDSTTHLHLGALYASYGDFINTDIFGNELGNFSGKEAGLIAGLAKQMNQRITLGLNVKFVFGNIADFSSFGAMTDIGIHYKNPESLWSFSFVIRNIGLEISPYTSERTSAPLDVQMGFSKRLKHLPFRFSIMIHDLHRFDIRYDDPNSPVVKEENEKSSFSKTIDNIFRHFSFGGEFLLGKRNNFNIRFGYNHLRKKELSLDNIRTLAGFSVGLGIKIRKIQISYAVGYHHHGGATNHISILSHLHKYKG